MTSKGLKAKGKAKASEPIHVFKKPPLCNVRLAVGRKYCRWYLIIAKDYPWLSKREITRLDDPRRPVWVTYRGQPCFWFNPKAEDWEGQDLLEFLLSISGYQGQEEIVKVVAHDGEGGKEVELRVPLSKIANYCEGCNRWESIEDGTARWSPYREGELPGYLCLEVYILALRL